MGEFDEEKGRFQKFLALWRFRAKFGRLGFRMKYLLEDLWRGKYYHTKQLKVYGVEEGEDIIVITAVVKYF